MTIKKVDIFAHRSCDNTFHYPKAVQNSDNTISIMHYGNCKRLLLEKNINNFSDKLIMHNSLGKSIVFYIQNFNNKTENIYFRLQSVLAKSIRIEIDPFPSVSQYDLKRKARLLAKRNLLINNGFNFIGVDKETKDYDGRSPEIWVNNKKRIEITCRFTYANFNDTERIIGMLQSVAEIECKITELNQLFRWEPIDTYVKYILTV